MQSISLEGSFQDQTCEKKQNKDTFLKAFNLFISSFDSTLTRYKYQCVCNTT